MSSSTLSAVIEKLICRLRLNDFPCGNGTWRNTNDSEECRETESTDALLDLLSCPHSPWLHDVSWSPQALPLRRLAVLTPERLCTHFIYNYFTALHIVDRGVTVIDNGLLHFSKLEELVLSANKISEIPTANLPRTLKILELRANRLSSLATLTSCPPPPHLQYLSLSSNSLGSHDVITHLTGRHWPQLVCLDLSDCEFQDQPALLNALSSLPCLKTLVLEGNPFTLTPSYPGLTVDSLPQLSYLDASWISPDERRHFRGLAKMSGENVNCPLSHVSTGSIFLDFIHAKRVLTGYNIGIHFLCTDLVVGIASAMVTVGKLMGIPDPLMSVDDKVPDFPVVTYSYFITYDFLSHQTLAHLVTYPSYTSQSFTISKLDTGGKSGTSSTANATEDQQSNKNCEKRMSKPDAAALVLNSEESCCDAARVVGHSTSKLSWSENMNFSDTQTHTVSSLADLKKFLNRGLRLRLEEEKVLSWPVTSEEVPVTKPSQTVKEKKGRKDKETPVKSESKYKDKKKNSPPELVQDTPNRRILGSVHVPLQTLVRGGQQVKVLCDFGILHTDSEQEATQTHQKALGKKNKEYKKKEDKEDKETKGSSAGQQNTALSKADKGKGKKELEVDDTITIQPEPVTVELSVELEKWQSASEAHPFLLPHQTS